MRLFRFLGLVAIVLTITGCSCKSRSVGPSENIPVASEGGPLSDIRFGYDSYSLDASAKAALRQNVQWLQENAESNVQIEGHCDSRGTNEYNMALGQKRANAVFEYARSLGVPASRMSTISYGEELPLDPRQNEAAWAKNRRAHFSLQE